MDACDSCLVFFYTKLGFEILRNKYGVYKFLPILIFANDYLNPNVCASFHTQCTIARLQFYYAHRRGYKI